MTAPSTAIAEPQRAIARWASCPLGVAGAAPWDVVARLPELVRAALRALTDDAYTIEGEIAIHRDARIEPGAELHGPAIIGPHAFVAATACVRGGAWLDAGVRIGRGCELKSSIVFEGSALAHFNYVGDSIVGADVNFEAGGVVCNHRNERPGATVHVRIGGRRIDTCCTKFGALVGDGCRIGANAVLAPGTLLPPGTVIARLAALDQDAHG
jgi:NDP-sugar pyrophosphorylase family protein